MQHAHHGGGSGIPETTLRHMTVTELKQAELQVTIGLLTNVTWLGCHADDVATGCSCAQVATVDIAYVERLSSQVLLVSLSVVWDDLSRHQVLWGK